MPAESHPPPEEPIPEAPTPPDPGARMGPRPPGRPQSNPNAESVKRRLIDTASARFSQRGYASVGVREIAREAGVTPAMIAYYFGDKQGLMSAVIGEVFERLLRGVTEMAATQSPDDSFAESFAKLYVGVLGRDPWIVPLVVREILVEDTPLRTQFIERFAMRAAQIVPQLFAREIREGRLRADLDPVLALLSLLGMCVFPFLAQPVMGPVLGYSLDPSFRERLVDHTARLYLDGARGDKS